MIGNVRTKPYSRWRKGVRDLDPAKPMRMRAGAEVLSLWSVA